MKEELKIIVPFGKPCSGKDTQSEKLLNFLDASIKISTGEILRSAQNQEGEFKEYYEDLKADFEEVDKGGYIKDEHILGVVKKVLAKYLIEGRKTFVFSGFPRTIPQEEIFEEMLNKLGSNFNITRNNFLLNVSDETARERSQKRIDENIKDGIPPRPEDMGENFEIRLTKFKEKTEPLISHLKGKNNLIVIDGSLSSKEVFSKIYSHLEEFYLGKERLL